MDQNTPHMKNMHKHGLIQFGLTGCINALPKQKGPKK